MNKRIVVKGTGTEYDGVVIEIPGDHTVFTIVKPYKLSAVQNPALDAEFTYDRIDLYPTGVYREEYYDEIWCPLDKMDEYRPPPMPMPSSGPKPPPSKVITLDSDLDDLDCDNEDEDESLFEDWWFGQREHTYDEMEKEIAERLKVTLLWEGKVNPGKKTFKIRDIT